MAIKKKQLQLKKKKKKKDDIRFCTQSCKI